MIERIRHTFMPLADVLGRFIGIDTIVAKNPEEVGRKWEDFAALSKKRLQIVSRDGHMFDDGSVGEVIRGLPKQSEVVVGPDVPDETLEVIMRSGAVVYTLREDPAQNFIIRDGDALLIDNPQSPEGERLLFEVHSGFGVIDTAFLFYQLKQHAFTVK